MATGIRTQLDQSYANKVREQFKKLVDDLNKGGRIDLGISTDKTKSELTDIKGSFNQILQEYLKLGKTSITPKFDENGNLNKFKIELEQIPGIIEKVNYEASRIGQIDIGNGKTKASSFRVADITELNKADKLAEDIEDKRLKAIADRESAEQERINTINAQEKSADDAEILRLGEQALAEQKIQEQEQLRVQKLGELQGSFGSDLFSKSDEEIKKYTQSLYDGDAKVASFARTVDNAGNSLIKMSINTKNGKNEIQQEKIVLDQNTQSVYKNSEAIKANTARNVDFFSRLKNAFVAVTSFLIESFMVVTPYRNHFNSGKLLT